MIAYKFLAKGALEPLSGLVWPAPRAERHSDWIDVRELSLSVAPRGLRVCRAEHLANWLHEELWVVETQGERRDSVDSLLVQRARLIQRIDAWQQHDAVRCALACAVHAASFVERVAASSAMTLHEYIEDARASAKAGYIAVSAHASALAAALARVELDIESSDKQAYRLERAWQSDWIAEHVILPNAV